MIKRMFFLFVMILVIYFSLLTYASVKNGDQPQILAEATPSVYLSKCLNALTPLKRRRYGEPLTEEEQRIAKTAWKYFENNYHLESGLVSSAAGFYSTTLWDTATYILAAIAAHDLGILPKGEFNKKMMQLVNTISNLKLCANQIPNKVYHTVTKEPVDYTNKPAEIGYSSLDIGRLLISLKLLKARFPTYAQDVDQIVLKWNFCYIFNKCGSLQGSYVNPAVDPKKILFSQEGRLGYEEYASKGFNLWGFNTKEAESVNPYSYIFIYCVPIPFDLRNPKKTNGHNYVVSESFMYEILEFGNKSIEEGQLGRLNMWLQETADNIFRVQKNRFHIDGILTARTEHYLDGPPYFLYDTIYSDGQAWNALDARGNYQPDFSAFSTKAAFSLWAIWDDDYSDLLYEKALSLENEQQGFYEGQYETSKGIIKNFTCNTNGTILQALSYKAKGPMFGQSPIKDSMWELMLTNKYANLDQQAFVDEAQKKCRPINDPCMMNESSCPANR